MSRLRRLFLSDRHLFQDELSAVSSQQLRRSHRKFALDMAL